MYFHRTYFEFSTTEKQPTGDNERGSTENGHQRRRYGRSTKNEREQVRFAFGSRFPLHELLYSHHLFA